MLKNEVTWDLSNALYFNPLSTNPIKWSNTPTIRPQKLLSLPHENTRKCEIEIGLKWVNNLNYYLNNDFLFL